MKELLLVGEFKKALEYFLQKEREFEIHLFLYSIVETTTGFKNNNNRNRRRKFYRKNDDY